MLAGLMIRQDSAVIDYVMEENRVGGETWLAIDCVSREGLRSMRCNSSLVELLDKHLA